MRKPTLVNDDNIEFYMQSEVENLNEDEFETPLRFIEPELDQSSEKDV